MPERVCTIKLLEAVSVSRTARYKSMRAISSLYLAGRDAIKDSLCESVLAFDVTPFMIE